MNISDLPKDVIIHLALSMDLPEILGLCRTSSRFNDMVCDNDIFWMNRLLNKSKLSMTDLRNIKGNLSYKKVYRYLYIGDYYNGILEAVKDDNVYLYKAIPIKKTDEFIIETAMDAAGYGSLEILNYIFINFSTDHPDIDLSFYIYSTASEKTIKWLDKMDLISYSDYIKEWIVTDGKDFENVDFPYNIIKKYLPKLKYSDGLMEALGSSLHYGDLESRKKIFDLFLEYNIDVENYKSAITTAERIVKDKNKLKEWIKYINNKMKN